jgi:aminoglycoside/choline kinase family phosphotransferase
MSAQAVPPQPEPVHELDFAPLAALIARAFPGAGAPAYEPMRGGASTRRYFRVTLDGATTAVAMFVPDGAKPEEVAQGAPSAARWPFLEVRDLLAARAIDVPVVHPDRREALYVRAVTDLARAQASLEALPSGSVVATRAFDAELLSWEIRHFREWALEARGIVLSTDDRQAFDALAGRLAQSIAAWPRAFVHRDYQSRNLMVRPDEKLCWIDFQDALLGPRVYDLVALLNDSYQEFDRAFVEARLDEFARAAGLAPDERVALGREFDYVTVQRKLKDAGRFVFIDQVKHNPSFLRFVTPTIRKVHGALARLDDDADMLALAALLRRAIPDEMLGVGTP